jgi:hypothetical protein
VCQLHAPADQKGAGANENRVRPLGCKRCECGGDLSAAAGVDNPDLQSHGASGRLHVSYRGLGHCSFGRIDEPKLYNEFEEAFVDVMTAKSEGLSFSRRMKLRLARSRLRAHKDFTQRDYEAAVLRADARAWKILG